ncbi:hypothetical protein ACFQHO_22485 [Actinomadura yumaensis]|uniref:hypothetical protein n=1 Tax=Actinomadura yumaensis TaxID=111807 RepID=UPI00361C84C0
MRRRLAVAALTAAILPTISALPAVADAPRSAGSGSAGSGSAASPAVTGGPVIRSAAVLGDGTGKVEVTHEPQVRRIELRVRRAGTAEVVAVLSDFALDGALTPVLDRWRSAGRVTLPPVGDFAVDVSVWSADGERTDKTDASRVTRRLRSKLSDVRISPEVYDAESGPLDLTGRLTSFDPDGTERPLAGARVTSGDGVFVTRADGTFSGKAPAARMVTVTYAGDGTHGATWADSNTIAFRELETRISIASTKAPLAGDKVTVSGLLERRTAAGAWGPLPASLWRSRSTTATPRPGRGAPRRSPGRTGATAWPCPSRRAASGRRRSTWTGPTGATATPPRAPGPCTCTSPRRSRRRVSARAPSRRAAR